MNNIFQLLLVTVIVTLTLLMIIVCVQVLLVIHDFRKLLKKIETAADLPRFYKESKDMLKDTTATAVKVKQFFHKK